MSMEMFLFEQIILENIHKNKINIVMIKKKLFLIAQNAVENY